MNTHQENRSILLIDQRPTYPLKEKLSALGYRVLEGNKHLEDSFEKIIIHASVNGWTSIGQRAKRDKTKCIIIAIVENLEQAREAVNILSVDHLATSDEEAIYALEELEARPAPLEAQVQARTAALQQIKAQWEQTFDSFSEPTAVIDQEMKLIRINRAYAKELNREIVELPGRKCYELHRTAPYQAFPQHEGICIHCPAIDARKRNEPVSTTLVDSNGKHWLVSAHPVKIDGHLQSVVVQYSDVTSERKRLDQLATESKLAAVGNLAGAIAHELNSPMTSIMVFSESLARKTADGSELNENALEINEAARRCRRLIQGLLRFARRPREIEMSPISIGQVFDEVLPLLAHRLDVASVTLKDKLPFDLPQISGYIADIEHVLVDLLVNALEACSAGDEISISAEARNEFIDIIIEDTGEGMKEATLARAFDPFFSTKSGAQGRGLGLTTCESIIGQMGGSIALRSVFGEGTKAVLSMPIWREHNATE